MQVKKSFFYFPDDKPYSVAFPLLQNVYDDDPVNVQFTPVFWPIPALGDTVMQPMLHTCYRLKLVKRSPGEQNASLDVIDGYVNIDLESDLGVSEAYQLGLIQNGVADVITTTQLHTVQNLFGVNDRPKLFFMIHHPFQRVFHLYNVNKNTTDASEQYNNFSHFLEKRITQNYITSRLSLIHPLKVDENSVKIATEILSKSLVGLFENSRESINRFQQYFNWTTFEDTETCVDKLMNHTFDLPTLSKSDPEWRILMRTNRFDLQLYENAKEIFDFQGKTLFG